jgi:hypothetical protein
MPTAVEHIRRMRGGAQSHLLRCREGRTPRGEPLFGYYVVKFQQNPQHTRILVNELLATRMAARLGLPTARVAVVHVPEELVRHTVELTFQLGTRAVRCPHGFHFGSRVPGSDEEEQLATAVHDFLPDEQLAAVSNLDAFAGILAFDKWTCNTNGRQAIFFLPPRGEHHAACMIDQGFCFNAGEWNFPDAPQRGLYARHRVYESVTGMDSFAPWLARMERINEKFFSDALEEIPPEWYDDDQAAVERLIEQLLRRRKRVPELIVDARNSYRQPFPNWR